ncbi:hypothetical protein, partial [Dietzia cinnamea]|uniref:hypothetical protein n=1 Tax=Dietzia cinnamea TaxID=321318 RepID=UPI0021A59E19
WNEQQVLMPVHQRSSGRDRVGFELAGDVGGLWNVDAADTRHCETCSAATPRSCASNRSGRG